MKYKVVLYDNAERANVLYTEEVDVESVLEAISKFKSHPVVAFKLVEAPQKES